MSWLVMRLAETSDLDILGTAVWCLALDMTTEQPLAQAKQGAHEAVINNLFKYMQILTKRREMFGVGVHQLYQFLL